MLVKDNNMRLNTFINVYLLVCHISMNQVKIILTHCGRVTQICVFNTANLGTSASSP